MADTAATNYVDYFGQASEDPFGIGPDKEALLQAFYTQWRTEAAAPTASVLSDLVVEYFRDETPGGLLVFVTDPDGVHRSQVFHGIRKYGKQIRNPSRLENKNFGYVGEVDEGEMTIVQLQESLFTTTGEINVCTVDHHRATLLAEPGTELIKHRDNTEPQTETIKTRMAAFLPYELMPLILDKRYTPRETFLVVDAHLTAAGLSNTCAPLLDFLRVAGTLAQNDVVLNALTEPGPAFHMEASLTKYMKKWILHRDLPNYRDAARRGEDPNAARLAASLSNLSTVQLRREEAAERRREAEDRPKTIASEFGESNTQKLLSLCYKSNTDELPDIYRKMANKKKKENYLSIVQDAIDTSAAAAGLVRSPKVTPSMVTFVQGCNFSGSDPSNVASGVLPMGFAPPGAASPQAKARSAADSEMVHSYMNMMSTVSQLLTSADAKELAKCKGYIPTNYSEASAQLGAYQAVLHALLGSNHPMYLEYRNGYRMYLAMDLELQAALDHEVGRVLGPPMLVYIFQTRVQDWFMWQWGMDEPYDVPQLRRELGQFTRTKNLNWLPSVNDVPDLYNLKLRAGRDGNGFANDRAYRQAPQTPATTPRVQPSSGGERQTQTRIVNPDWDPVYQENNEFCRNITNWRIAKAMAIMREKGKEVPNRTDGRPMCLTYHLKGSSFKEDKMAYDHKKQSPEDKQKLLDWAREAYA